jgi:hypothetical protein
MKRVSALIILLAVVFLGGLPACTSPAPPVGKGYYGPTLTLSEVIGKINENNAKIPTLWSRERFTAKIVDREKVKSSHVDGYGTLLYTAPNQMRLTAGNELASMFEMGSNGQQFWLWEKHDQIFWYGDFAAAGNMESAEIPVRPDMVMEILGIRPIDPKLLHEPIPTMRFNIIGDAYMVDWQAPAEDHWVTAKEIWYDRQTLRPWKVLLFDGRGRVALVAQLSNYVQVKVAKEPESEWPWIASEYQLFFPYSGTTMAFELSDVSLTMSGRPNSATYRMPDPAGLSESGVKVNQLDAQNGR